MQYGMVHWPSRLRSRSTRIGHPLILGVLLLALGLTPAVAVPPQVAAHHTQAQLRAVRAQIARIARQISRSTIEQGRLTRQLRSSEKSAGTARSALASLRQQRAAGVARQAVLSSQRRQREADLDRNRRILAGEMRAAYAIGRQGPLVLLLNQGAPARTSRLFAYYSYFSRARAQHIQDVESDLAHIDQLDSQLAAEDSRLAEVEQRQQAQVAQLDQANAHRRQVLAGMAAATRTRAQRLRRLQGQQRALESLLAALRRAERRLPVQQHHFDRLQGHLPWPVSGRLIARFGEARAGGLRWDGDLIATPMDAPVHAVGPGRVVYADWLAGLGLLVIIDHGGGYMSLYGHNDHLYAHVGQQVTSGQMIAATGDTGGASQPELYFGIRHGTRPVDPRLWLERHGR